MQRTQRYGEKTKEKEPPGNGIFSRRVAPRVSSALERFTSVFGMGTGGSAPLQSPKGSLCEEVYTMDMQDTSANRRQVARTCINVLGQPLQVSGVLASDAAHR